VQPIRISATVPDLCCNETDFIRRAAASLPRLMWFLGAGASRTAGMPTAGDIIWDLKRRYYCLHENQDLQAHNVNNQAVRAKIQGYMASKGFPPAGSPEEYAFYFTLTFGDDLAGQQRYIADLLSPDKIALNIGHRALGAMLESGHARVIFGTNFDEVVERAYAFVSGKVLTGFHLEGSYAALDALNAERYPLYAKVHGDFRYQSLKNLPADLIGNDAEIQKCFLAASTRFGMIVSGYSGRDVNVMSMFRGALDQSNAFPHGLYWTVPRLANVGRPVQELVALARSKNVAAYIVEAGTFDSMLMRLWRQQPHKPDYLDAKIYTAKAQPVAIPLPASGGGYPVLRTNGLPIVDLPKRCGRVVTEKPVTFAILNEQRKAKQPDVVATFAGQALFWGGMEEASRLFEEQGVKQIEDHDFEQPLRSVVSSSVIKSFFEEGLVRALCFGKPVVIRRKDRTWYAVVDHRENKNPLLTPMRDALGSPNVPLNGFVPKQSEMYWAECVSLKLEGRNGSPFLMIRPDIWITPLSRREQAATFLREKKLRRWNTTGYRLLDAWIGLLVGPVGSSQEAHVACFQNTKFPVSFKVNTRSAYSCRGVTYG
jgi:hypothetical protein